ncbi:MAG: hypothetical protein RLP15_09940 [Cryomorphaceae bacterium]
MKDDIDFPKVEQVGVCAVPHDAEEMKTWKVHIINLLDEPITNVLVSTRGYAKKNDDQVSTSELRHFFEDVQSKSSRPIEVIPQDLIGLNNQYWVSFYIGRTIYDKKFIFLPDTLLEKNLVDLPVMEEKGILIL